MTCIAIVLRTILTLQLWAADASVPIAHRVALYIPVAEAICAVAPDSPAKQAWLMTQTEAETHLAVYVLEDRCETGPPGARCDEGKATGPWQNHGWCRAAWDKSATAVERFTAGAKCALYGWREGHPARSFQNQKNAGPVEAWVKRRVVRMNQIHARLEEL